MGRLPTIFVTDTHLRTAHYVADALARVGYVVIGLRSRASPYDRSCAYVKLWEVPSLESSDEWLCAVEKLASGGEVLMPISLQACMLVADNRERLKRRFLLPRTTTEELALGTDKLASVNFLRGLGVPVPESWPVGSREETMRIAQNSGFPIVLKVRNETGLAPGERYGIARSAAELEEIWGRLSELGREMILQRFVEGQGVGVSFLSDDGRIRAIFCHERRREALQTGGPSTYCAAFDSPTLEDYAARFAMASGWNGVAMMEFKRTKSGEEFFLELNPRFWGSLELAIKSGVNFPVLYAEWVQGKPLPQKVVRKRRNVRLKMLEQDIEAFRTSICGLSRMERMKQIFRYLSEFLDSRLEFEPHPDGPRGYRRMFWRAGLELAKVAREIF